MIARNLQLDSPIAIFDDATGEFHPNSVLGMLLDCPKYSVNNRALGVPLPKRLGGDKSLTSALNEMIQKTRLSGPGFALKVLLVLASLSSFMMAGSTQTNYDEFHQKI